MEGDLSEGSKNDDLEPMRKRIRTEDDFQSRCSSNPNEWAPLEDFKKCNDVFKGADLMAPMGKVLMNAVKNGDVATVKTILTKLMKRRKQLENDATSILEFTEEQGSTPLMVAAKSEFEPIVRLLIEHGANVNAENEKGHTALVLASQKGNFDICKLILTTEVEIKSTNMALIPAAHFGYTNLVQLFLDAKADVNCTNTKGTTSLMRASQEGKLDVVMMLLKYRANPNLANAERMTPLMLAAQRGHHEVVQALISAGADVNMQTRQGSTALLLAAKRGHESAVRVLVAAGADIYKQDERHKTPRDSAQRRGFSHLLDILTQDSQVELMRRVSRVSRNYLLVKLSILYVHGRAEIRYDNRRCSKEYCSLLSATLKLPLPLLQMISSMIPFSRLWSRQYQYLTTRVTNEPDAVAKESIRILDEILSDTSAGIRDTRAPSNLRLQGETALKRRRGRLIQLRDQPSFAFKFRASGPLRMSPALFLRLKEMANHQGSLEDLGEDGISFKIRSATKFLILLRDTLCWEKSTHQERQLTSN